MDRLWLIVLVLTSIFGCNNCAVNNEISGDLPFCRSKSEMKTNGPNRSLVIVSTLDGRVSAIDAKNGAVVWSLLTGPDTMLSSSISKLEMTSKGKWMRLVPSLDGGLYKFDGTSIEALPVTAESLLSSSLKLADDMIISGCNENRVYGIDYSTGKLRYKCNSAGCQTFEDSNDDVIVIRRRTHVIRAVDPRTGLEKWNYSVGQHEVSLLENPQFACSSNNEDIDGDETDANPLLLDQSFFENLRIKFIPPEGKVMGVMQDGRNNKLWEQMLNSPVIDAWSLHDNSLEQMDLLSTVHMPEYVKRDENFNDMSATLYLGIHDKQLYVKQSKSLSNKVSMAFYTDEGNFPKINWKPYLVTAVSRTPTITGNKYEDKLPPVTYIPEQSVESTALIMRQDIDYPYDGGFYIFPEETPIETSLISTNSSEPKDDESVPVIVIVSLTYWWRELTAFALLFIYLNYLLTRYFWKRSQRLEKNNNVISRDNNDEVKTKSESPLSQSLTVDTPKADDIIPKDLSPRLLTDFTLVRCLGRGGFGVVFHGRHKIDDCDYAIKRLSLENREETLGKVMREVKALAKLEHHGIVRYHQAWIELTPEEWLEEIDKQSEAENFTTTESAQDSSHYYKKSNVQVFSCEEHIFDNEKNILQTNSYGFVNSRQAEYFGSSNYDHSALGSGSNGITIPFNNYTSADTTDDSFIVFEDSGCDKKNEAVEVSNAGTLTSDDVSKNDNSPGGKKRNSRPNSFSSHLVLSGQKSKTQRLYLYISTQMCRKENLKDWLNNNISARNKLQVLDFFDQIVCAVEYVHSKGLMHRDLKPSNIFFAMDGTIKVGDFGLVATLCKEDDQHSPCTEGPMSSHTDKVGTQLYMSPEQIAGKTYSHKVDIFSLGLIFFELLVPFKTQMERLKVLLDVKDHKFPQNFLNDHPEERKFVLNMLALMPERRPEACDIRKDPLLQVIPLRPEELHQRRRTLSGTFSLSSSDLTL